MSLNVNPGLDPAPIRARFDDKGRVQIRDFLTAPSAGRLARNLEEQAQWNLAATCRGRYLDLDYDGFQDRPLSQRKGLESLVHEDARDGFAYLYCNLPLYELAHSGKMPGLLLLEAYRLFNDPTLMAFIREVAGIADISFADAQATKYLPGHFLTLHDDGNYGKNRCLAYVLSMNRRWRADWGGQLQFFGNDGTVTESFLPAFNTLSLFNVPQPHSVSIVAPFAGAPRYSITGWFRTGEDPGPG